MLVIKTGFSSRKEASPNIATYVSKVSSGALMRTGPLTDIRVQTWSGITHGESVISLKWQRSYLLFALLAFCGLSEDAFAKSAKAFSCKNYPLLQSSGRLLPKYPEKELVARSLEYQLQIKTEKGDRTLARVRRDFVDQTEQTLCQSLPPSLSHKFFSIVPVLAGKTGQVLSSWQVLFSVHDGKLQFEDSQAESPSKLDQANTRSRYFLVGPSRYNLLIKKQRDAFIETLLIRFDSN